MLGSFLLCLGLGSSAVAIVAEIDDVKHFAGGANLASWAGLGPSAYQSVGR
jgi:transposase